MERLNENEKSNRRKIGVGFIKSRKADHKVMDYCERMIEEAEKEGYKFFLLMWIGMVVEILIDRNWMLFMRQ
ncbi:MAG: hypothetical protein NC089_12470 [Bacteroides sp.]|nr:hypothetical protein [Bacteroides sp.]MCM1550778.1 hypothetical protein [Clostridium sp.]